MTADTVLAHWLVRSYLRTLDDACAGLPYPQARELHEQIAAHLEEALPPGADDATVRAELARLGRATAIAAVAAGPVPPAGWRRLRNRLGHVRRVRQRTWVISGVLIAVLGTGSGFLISMNTAPVLVASGEIGWLNPADQAAAVYTTAGDVTQTAVSYRFGQRQGIVVDLVNDSDWTQRIVGVGRDWQFGSLPGMSHVSVAVVPGQLSDHYTSPGAIPPHSTRNVRLWWTSNECMGAGGASEVSDIELRVRVGAVTRTEDIALQMTFVLTGPKHSIVRNCQ
jgi:hypothetical protein